ncbi:MAG: sulfatase-like hydrolase/transferase [Calditrichaeota bacterium]|nr:sulfatase-like hydrolase/transferase [Calditrichota bacterium]
MEDSVNLNISRRTFLRQSALGALSASLLPASVFSGEGSGGRPNIIFFIADDMYPDMFNFLPEGRGKNLTPNLDRLAREGTILMNQYVSSPLCTPSRYSCLTGRYASRARNEGFLRFTQKNGGQTVVNWNTFITPEDRILPHYLKEAGYATGMVGKNHVIEVKGLEHFDDYYADPTEPEVAAKIERNYRRVVSAIRRCGFDYAGGIYHNNPDYIGLWKLAVHNLDWITAHGLRFIEENRSRPFFLYFATTVPHDPNEPERSWRADRRITPRGILDKPPEVLPPPESYPERLAQAGLAGSGRENVLWLDDALGALLTKLEQLGLLQNTLIFFFNDQGQKAKGTLYQGGIHDPSVVWQPGGFPVGPVCTTPVSNIDFLPTILDFVGLSVPEAEVDGRSFKPVLDGKTDQIHPALYFELGYTRAVIKGEWKYLALRYPERLRHLSLEERRRLLLAYNTKRLHKRMPIVTEDPTRPFSHLTAIPGGGYAEVESTGKKPGYYDPDQLYNLETDPDELHNLAREEAYKPKLAEMKRVLQGFLDQLPGKFDLDTK